MTRRTMEQYDWDNLLFDETLLDKHYTPDAPDEIKFCVLHHMMIPDRNLHAPDALDTCFEVWQTREASAQYGVEEGFVRQFVNDWDYAWATASTYGNDYGISIEHANATLAPDYRVSEKTWKTGSKLVAYIHKFYNMGRPVANVTVKRHSDFFATACPGPFMNSIFHQYVAEAQRIYDLITNGGQVVESSPTPRLVSEPRKNLDQLADEVINGHWGNGDDRKIRLNSAGYNYDEVQRRVNEMLGVATKSVGEVADEVIKGFWGNGQERIDALTDAGYNFEEVQAEVNRRLS